MPALILHYIRKTWGVLGSQVVSCLWVCVSEWYWIRADNFLLVQLAWVPGDDMIVGTWVRSCWNSSIFYKSWRSNGSNRGFSKHSLLPLYFGFALHTVLLSAYFVSSETRSLTICAHRPKSVTFKAAELPCSGIMISSSILIQRQSGLVPLNHLCCRCRWSKVSSHVDSAEADIVVLVSRCTVVICLRQNVLSSLVSTKQNTLALLKPSQAHFAPWRSRVSRQSALSICLHSYYTTYERHEVC